MISIEKLFKNDMAVSSPWREGKSLMRQFCNFRRECHQDVHARVETWIQREALEEIISEMISEKDCSTKNAMPVFGQR